MTALRHKRKMSGDVFVLNLIAYTFCGLVALLCLVPFIIIVSSSLSSEEAVLQNGCRYWAVQEQHPACLRCRGVSYSCGSILRGSCLC